MADYQQNFLNALQGGYQFGQQIKEGQDRSAFNKLAGQAYGSQGLERQSAIGKLMGIDAGKGLKLEEGLQSSEDARTKTIVSASKLLSGMPAELRAENYQRMLPDIRRVVPNAPDWTPETEGQITQTLESIAQAYGDGDSSTPTGYRELEMKVKAAGYTPGTDEYKEAFKVALGTSGRAASGGYGFDTVEWGGRKYPSRTNPRNGSQEIWDGSQWLNLGAGAGLSNTPPPSAPPAPQAPGRSTTDAEDNQFAQRMNSIVSALQAKGFTPEQIEAALPAFEAATNGTAGAQQTTAPASVPAPAPAPLAPTPVAYGAPAPRPVSPGLPSGIGVSRTADEQASLTTTATEGAKLPFTVEAQQREDASALNRIREEARIKREAELAGKDDARTRDADSTIAFLREAIDLLPDATGGKGGSTVDRVAGAVGLSTKGAQATAQLKLIAAGLVSKVPRFEGPQSNIDVQFYREAAGDLANDTLPVETRLAAARKMLQMQQKYSTKTAPPTPSQQGNPAIDALMEKYR